MRKIFALALAVLMLAVMVVMPIAAAEDLTRRPLGVYGSDDASWANRAKFDLTTKDQSLNGNVANKDLIVTEVSFNSSYSNGIKGTVETSDDIYNYIEIYNRGNTPVDLSQVAIAQMNDLGAGNNTTNTWDVTASFDKNTKVIRMYAGANIYQYTGMTETQWTSRYKDAPVDNPTNIVVQPGEFAIVWLWSDVCVNASRAEGSSIAANYDPANRENFPNFRDHYASVMGIEKGSAEWEQLESTLILAVHCDSSLSNSMKFYDYSSHVYALVDANNFDATTTEYVNFRAGTHTPYVYSFFGWGTNERHNIMGSVEDVATIYVPSASAADLYWGYKKQEFGADKAPEAPAAGATQEELDKYQSDLEAFNKAVEDYQAYVLENFDYVALGISNSYLEMAVMSGAETPSIGTMPSYQWKYVDADRMADHVEDDETAYIADWNNEWADNEETTEVKETVKDLIYDSGALTATWEEDLLAALIGSRVVELEDTNKEAAAERDEIFVDQNWWENMEGSNEAGGGTNTGTGTNTGNKRPDQKKLTDQAWFWVLVIGGPVLVLAAVAAVVIFVILPKKKKVAADDVAPETGDVVIIDETTVPEEAPVEEAPVEEAPTEE